ncbi:MAG: hypothetical protein AAF192_09530 [Pseudomonadota bacterium]
MTALTDDELATLRAVGPFVAAFAAVALWALSRLAEAIAGWLRSTSARRAMIRAISAEIDYNTSDLAHFVDASPPIDQIRSAIQQNPNFIPHVTDARHTVVYRDRIGDLHRLDDDYIASVVRFYGELEKIREQIEGIRRPSYLTISETGRLEVVRRLTSRSRTARDLGLMVLERMERTHPRYRLKRGRPTEG